jgi:hypothetical protein
MIGAGGGDYDVREIRVLGFRGGSVASIDFHLEAPTALRCHGQALTRPTPAKPRESPWPRSPR